MPRLKQYGGRDWNRDPTSNEILDLSFATMEPEALISVQALRA
jgi:hypothetical protein